MLLLALAFPLHFDASFAQFLVVALYAIDFLLFLLLFLCMIYAISYVCTSVFIYVCMRVEFAISLYMYVYVERVCTHMHYNFIKLLLRY